MLDVTVEERIKVLGHAINSIWEREADKDKSAEEIVRVFELFLKAVRDDLLP